MTGNRRNLRFCLNSSSIVAAAAELADLFFIYVGFYRLSPYERLALPDTEEKTPEGCKLFSLLKMPAWRPTHPPALGKTGRWQYPVLIRITE